MKTTVSRHTHTDTKALILKEANALLLTRSYLGLSFQELADRVGIRKASLYHHFDSKETLGIALIDEAQTKFARWSQRLQGQSVAQKMQAYILMFRNAIGAGERVCPIGATGGEWDCLEPALQGRVRHFHQFQLDWLTQAVAPWQAPSSAQDSDAQQLLAQQRATQINAMLQGALLSARVHADVAVFDTAVAPLQLALEQLH